MVHVQDSNSANEDSEVVGTFCYDGLLTLGRKAAIHPVTTMLATSKNVLFPGHNHLLTTGADDPSLAGTCAIIKILGHQHRWLAGG